MKTKKLNLSDLKVDSFVTSLNIQSQNTVKGGGLFVALIALLGGCAAQQDNEEGTVSAIAGCAGGRQGGSVLDPNYDVDGVMGESCVDCSMQLNNTCM